MKYLIMLVLPLGLLFMGGCVDCDQVTEDYTAATSTFGSSASASDCDAMVDAWQEGVDGGCDGYEQSQADALQAACDAAFGS